jgi:hypothetical protein
VELAVALTLWLSFGAFLFFPTVRAPALFARVAISLCAGELVAALIWAIAHESCDVRPCGPLAETARTAAALDIPALTALMFVLATAHGVRLVGRGPCASSSPEPAARSARPPSRT